MLLDELRYLLDAAEAAHGLEGGQGNGHLRLMVGITVGLGIFNVKLLRKVLIRMSLDGKSLAAGKYFEQEGELTTKELFQCGSTDQLCRTLSYCVAM